MNSLLKSRLNYHLLQFITHLRSATSDDLLVDEVVDGIRALEYLACASIPSGVLCAL